MFLLAVSYAYVIGLWIIKYVQKLKYKNKYFFNYLF
jgi:hypothetical protein